MNDLALLTRFTGEIAALTAAFLWSIASVIYSKVGQKIPPIGLNLIKGVIALGFLGLTLGVRGGEFPPVSGVIIGLLLISGMIGIGVGDSAYFATLNCLGPRRALLMETLAPPLTAILALIFLQERLSTWAWGGILLTILGVAWVVTERFTLGTIPDSLQWQGLGYGLIAELCQAVGVTLSRYALTQTSISPLWSTSLRLLGGVSILVLWLVMSPGNSQRLLRPLGSRPVVGIITLATFLGTFLGIWLQQTAFKFTAAGIAQALSSTSPLFVLPIAISMGDRVSLRALLGALVAILGIILLFQG
ncbi:MAG: DMT family transporter [Oscillatoriales cyanobacterium RM2_1_1]|nr:DMT family transporter [Oscillatoriales cyanobacterium RM2_1_1]